LIPRSHLGASMIGSVSKEHFPDIFAQVDATVLLEEITHSILKD